MGELKRAAVCSGCLRQCGVEENASLGPPHIGRRLQLGVRVGSSVGPAAWGWFRRYM